MLCFLEGSRIGVQLTSNSRGGRASDQQGPGIPQPTASLKVHWTGRESVCVCVYMYIYIYKHIYI
jgi:hypothetical protein